MNLLFACNLLNISLLTAINFLLENKYADVSVKEPLSDQILNLLKGKFDKDGCFETKENEFKNEEKIYRKKRERIRQGKCINTDKKVVEHGVSNPIGIEVIGAIANAFSQRFSRSLDHAVSIEKSYMASDEDCYILNTEKSHISFDTETKKDWFLKSLSERTKEKWGCDKKPYEVLENYISRTYSKLIDENKLIQTKHNDSTKIVFNSGLIDHDTSKYLYIIGIKKKGSCIHNPKIIDTNDLQKNGLASKDMKPAFYGDVMQIDATWDINIDDSSWFHIVEERNDRISDYRECRYKNLNEVEMERLLRATVRDEHPQRNGAVRFYPFYYFKSDNYKKIQYLLPLYLGDSVYDNSKTPNCVLVLDPDYDKKILKPHTIFTPTMAYMDARLVCNKGNCPSESWLIE